MQESSSDVFGQKDVRNKTMISVVMPVFIFTHPQITFFKQAVESILNQTYKNFELIIVDDGSQLDYAIPLDDRIKFFKKEHGGTSRARNFGIKKMMGDFYCSVDADDFYDPNMLEMMLDTLENGADVVYSSFYDCSMDGTDKQLRMAQDFDPKRLAKEQYIPGIVMVRKEKLAKYVDKISAYEHWLFFIGMVLNGARFVKIDWPLWTYRRSPMSLTCRVMYDGRKIRELRQIKREIKKYVKSGRLANGIS